jgi:large repetitive protein
MAFVRGGITNDDAAPTLSIADARRVEGNAGTSTLWFKVTQSVPSGLVTKVRWSTADGTAMAPSDYTSASLPIYIGAGATFRWVGVAINGDVAVEANETFRVNLTNPRNATLSDSQAIGTIRNDDAPCAVRC